MRGRTRILVLATLATAAVTAGAAVALVPALAWAALDLPRPSAVVSAGLVALAVAADLAWARTGGPRPWAVHTQVPVVWGRVFGPVTVAVLYGLRLGVGPLTLLNTWTWWAAFAIAVAHGPWGAVAVSVAWGLVRAGTTAAVASRLAPDSTVSYMEALRGRDAQVRAALAGAALSVAAVAAVAGSVT